jgi:hypothetical protein
MNEHWFGNEQDVDLATRVITPSEVTVGEEMVSVSSCSFPGALSLEGCSTGYTTLGLSVGQKGVP